MHVFCLQSVCFRCVVTQNVGVVGECVSDDDDDDVCVSPMATVGRPEHKL